LLDRDPHGNV
jgi:hypothetical protein